MKAYVKFELGLIACVVLPALIPLFSIVDLEFA
jgi:hypothetical protein